MKKGAEKGSETKTVISPPMIVRATVPIVGTSDYVQLRFSKKAFEKMRNKQEKGDAAKKDKKKTARDFRDDFLESYYQTESGRFGIPATAFRSAMISACRLCGFTMAAAKQAVFVEADDIDKKDGTPLVLIKGKPKHLESPVRNSDGSTDIRVRARFEKGWTMDLKVTYDAEAFTAEDLANLVARAGFQVGVGEGRAASKKSCGMGWGFFSIRG